jgi:hypothetical protein
MLKLNALAVIGVLAVCGTAHAEFVMLAPPAAPAATGAPPGAPLDIRPDPLGPNARKHVTSARKDPPAAIPIANGFGQSVPLAFAVRQIVPATIQVSYGPTADQDALVDWRGGRKWTRVLREAVRPLGLRVRLRRSTVTIGK